MLETYSEQQLQPLVVYEVKDSAGEKVGYVDVVFVDDETGQP
jgi:sporulation protein YlmC with PRC-barrel domain